MNLLEEAIAFFSPRSGVERARNRMTLDRVRGYEAGGKGRRTKGWKTQSRDANAEILHNLSDIRNRSRDLRRNNAFALAAIESIIDNSVGYGIKPKFETTKKSLKKRYSMLWKEHCESTAIDWDGKHNIYGLQALWFGSMAESGEVLIRRRHLGSKSGKPLAFQLQTLESDYLDSSRDQDGTLNGGKLIIGGVQFGASSGQAEGYWLFDQHPGAAVGMKSFQSKFIPAADILHVFRVDRPGQVRGVPWSSAVVMRLRNLDEAQDSFLTSAKIASCFSVFVTGPETDAADKSKLELADRVSPGGIHLVPTDSDISFGTPGAFPAQKDFSWIELHAIAAGFQVPYEVFGDLTGVNFSSGRMGWQNYQRRIERWQWQTFIPGALDGVAAWFNEAAELSGKISEIIKPGWVPPRRLMVNPKEEIAAMKEAIRNGFETWGDTLLTLGYDPEDQAESIKIFNDLMDKYELKLDCDPRFALPAGSAGATEPDPDGSEPAKPVKTKKTDDDGE